MPTDSPNHELRTIANYMLVLYAAQQLHDKKYKTITSRIRHRRSFKSAEKGLQKHREFVSSELNRLKDEISND